MDLIAWYIGTIVRTELPKEVRGKGWYISSGGDII